MLSLQPIEEESLMFSKSLKRKKLPTTMMFKRVLGQPIILLPIEQRDLHYPIMVELPFLLETPSKLTNKEILADKMTDTAHSKSLKLQSVMKKRS